VVATILLVDDSESARGLMRRTLEQAQLGVQILEAQDGAEALPLALSGDVDVVVSDIVMPNLDGIALLRAIRQQKDHEALPVVLVTTQADHGSRELSLDAGANDYLTRPFAPGELVSRVQVQLRLKRLQQELRRAIERHRRLATHDELTELANRRHLIELCRRELARSRRYKFDLTVVVLDIVRFREINQRVGTLVGDAILSELGALLSRELRAPDVVGRIAGGKFGALLPQTNPEQALAVCQRLLEAVRSHAFPSHDQGQLCVCIGFAGYPDGNLESVDELFNAAEANLERAKGLGPDRVEGPPATLP
jgi:diguanylate cyclase (GGDEF)-like protein